MCEKRNRKIKKGSNLMRLREARRIQRLQRMGSPPVPEAPRPCQQPPADKNVQSRVLLELALKTVALMQKNKIIQQKIVALQKETSEFVASVMRNPENQRRYMENLRIHGLTTQSQDAAAIRVENIKVPVKVEPSA